MIEYARRIVWIPVINMTAETIPGGALMEPYAISNPVDNGQDTDGNWTVRKPTIDNNPRVIVNGESPIPPGEVGQGHRDTMAVVLYDTTESKPLAGDNYGAKSGSWFAHKDYTGFVIDHAGNGRANAQRVNGNSQANSEIKVTGAIVAGPLDYYPGTIETTTDGSTWTSGATVRLVNTGSAALVNGNRYTSAYIGTISGVLYFATRNDGSFPCDAASLCLGGWATRNFVTDVSLSCTAGTLTLTVTKRGNEDYWVK